MFSSIRDRLHQVKSRAVTVGYQLTGEQQHNLTVNDVSATFKVASHAERWRVKDCMDEREVVEQFLNQIDSSAEVWDIGAAVGTYSILAAKKSKHITAFEPEPTNAARLRENADLNDLDNITVREIALSATNGTTQMKTSDGAVGAGAHHVDSKGEFEVTIQRGADLDSPNPTVIKIDVEGHEVEVLDGLGEKLETCETIFIEVHEHMGVDSEDVVRRLKDTGFEVSKLSESDRSEVYLMGERHE